MTLIAQPAKFHNAFRTLYAGQQASAADPEGLGVRADLHASAAQAQSIPGSRWRPF
jgi:hypothetical protein